MSSAQDLIEDPYTQSYSTSSPLGDDPIIQERDMSHSDQTDHATPQTYTESTPHHTTNSSFDSRDEKAVYNGPSTIYVVMLRVSNESSARPMPQAAFFNQDKALAFSTRILLQWCDGHYDDYIWKGPEDLRSGLMKRYAAYHAQSGQQLAVADVIKVSIFDAKETAAVPEKRDGEEEKEDDEEENKEQFGEGPHEEYIEERSDEDQDDAATTTTPSARTEDQDVDVGELGDDPEEGLPTIYSMQAAAEYAMDLVTRRAAREERVDMGSSSHRGAWREDYEMRVFGGPTE